MPSWPVSVSLPKPARPMYQLLHDQTNDLECTGTYTECLARYHQLCGLRYDRHREFCTDTYTIHPLN